MSEAKMTTRGRITLPREIRKRLRLSPGDRLRFVIEEDGDVRMLPPKRDITSLRGILPRPKRTATLQQMEEAIRRGAVQRFLGHDRV